MSEMVTAEKFFSMLATGEEGLEKPVLYVDVRSPLEFQRGHFPGAYNVPILDNEQRHRVGLTYRKEGRNAAISLGIELTNSERVSFVGRLRSISEDRQVYIGCARGGLRSRFACEWLADSAVPVQRIEGGYKRLRSLVLAEFEELGTVVCLGGLTGVGKTDLLKALPASVAVDLEGHANHRGSAFGRYLGQGPVTQQVFENGVGLALSRVAGPVVVEDESARIGPCLLPHSLVRNMAVAPLVILEAPLATRVERIWKEYIADEYQQEGDLLRLKQKFMQSTMRISRKLGGKVYREIADNVEMAFQRQDALSFEAHEKWISMLLEFYYDPMYEKCLRRKSSNIVFRGNFQECLEYFSSQGSEGLRRFRILKAS